jgi:WD40 repeat protein
VGTGLNLEYPRNEVVVMN